MGVATLAKLKDMRYPNLYYQTNLQKISDEETERVGFKTSVSTKPAIIGNLKNALKNREISIPDEELIKELKEYIVTDGGKYEAMQGCFDDSVMALAFCLEAYRTHQHRLTATRQGHVATAAVLDETVWF